MYSHNNTVWNGKKIKATEKFESSESDFKTIHEVEKFLNDRGFVVGSMQRDAPIAFSKRTEDIDSVPKWRNIEPEDFERLVDGVILCDDKGFRNGAVTVLMLGEKVTDSYMPPAIDDIEDVNKGKSYYDRDDRIKYLIEQGELGDFIASGNTRDVYSHAKYDHMVIKIPVRGMEDDADAQSREEYATHMKERAHRWVVEECKLTVMADCSWDEEHKILMMERVEPIPGTKNLGMSRSGVAKIYDIF